jgi:hypothetical protein
MDLKIMTICLLLFFFIAVMCLGKYIHRREDIVMRRIFPDWNWKHRTACEWCDDGNRLMAWRQAHPFGPLSDPDREELSDLIMQLIASYMIYRQAHGLLMVDEHVEYMNRELLELEDWRV